MGKECEPLSLPVRDHLEKEELHVLKNHEFALTFEGTKLVDKDSRTNNHTKYFLVILLFLIIGMFFTALYFRLNGLCSGRFFLESSILNKEDIIKPELDPCDDFYSFACGRWNPSASYNDNVKSVIQETEIRNLLRLECFLRHSSSRTLNPWSKFVQKTYELCEMEMESPIDESKTVDFVKTAAAPLIHNRHNQNGLDYVLHRIHHKFLQSGLFSWDVTLDMKDSEILQAVRIAPQNKPWYDDVPFTSRQHLVEYMKEILLLLGAEKERLRSKCEDMADFILLSQTHAKRDRSKVTQRKLLTLGEFVKGFDFIDFDVYFREFRLTESVPVVVEESDYFSWLRNQIKNAEEGSAVIQNFLYWSLIQFFVPYMPKAFGEVRDKYASKLGMKGERRYVCLNAVKKGMNFAVSSFFMDKVLDDKSREMESNFVFYSSGFSPVNDIVTHVKNSFRDSLYFLQNPNVTSEKWLRGLDGVFKSIEIGIPTHLRDIYEDDLPFVPMGDSFPSYLITGTKFVKERMLGHINEVPLAVLFLSDYIQVNGIFASIPLLIMNMGILTPPIFHSRQPLSLNYAGLGFVLSHELAHSIDYLASDDMSAMIDLKFKLGCLNKQYNQTKPLSNVIREDFADNVGIKIAYKAYVEHVSRRYNTRKINSKERKMFFIHFSQIFCEDGSSFHTDKNANHSPYKDRVNIPLSNFPDFSETFSCPKGSRMNNENKCLI